MDEWLSVCVRGKGCGSSLFVAVSLDVFSFYNILVRHLILDRTALVLILVAITFLVFHFY